MCKKMLRGMLFVILIFGFVGISNSTEYQYQIIDVGQFMPAGANISSVRINDNNIIAGHYKEDGSEARYLWWYNLGTGIFDSEFLGNAPIDLSQWSYNTINLNNLNEIILRSRIFDIDTETWSDTPISGVIDKNDNGVYLTYHYIWDNGVVTNFHPPGAYDISWGQGLNNSKNVTGWCRFCEQCYHRGFIWNSEINEYTIISIDEHLHLLDINDNNIAVGRYPGNPEGTLAIIDGHIERIGIIPNSLYTGVNGINNSNVIVGLTDLGNGKRVFIGTPKPVAYFTADPLTGLAPLIITFTDESTGTIDTWEWDFGDNSDLSSEQNPSHTYDNPGIYTVSLIVTGPGGSDTETKTDYITVNYPAPVAHFTAGPITGVHPLTVNFTDQSAEAITSWSWDFDDGSTSNDQNPQHTYQDTGTYTVSLTVTGPGGTHTETKTDYIVVDYITPVANFISEPTNGILPFTVNFTDESTGDITSWLWDFGDGGSSTEQNPIHIYTEKDLYTVTLAVSGPEGLDTEIKTDYITAYEELTLTYPNGGEIILSGSYYTIEWLAPFSSNNFKLKLSMDNGKTWEKIDDGIIDNSYDWDIPIFTKNKTNCLIKVVGYDTSGVKVGADTSDETFTIAVLTVMSPNGGEVVPSGDPYDIEWETNGTESEVDSVELYYSRDGGIRWKLIDEALIGNPGTYEWTVPAQKKNFKDCLVKVKALDVSGNKIAVDKSDAPFTIAVLEVTSPDGEETLKSGDTHPITWTTHEAKAEVAKVKLLYTKNGGETWIKIDALTEGDPESYDWLVPPVNKVKTECRVKVELKDAQGNIVGKAASDSYFTIEPLI